MKYLLASAALILSQTATAQTSNEFLQDFLTDFAVGKDLSHFYVEQPQFIFGKHILTPSSSVEANGVMHDIREKLIAAQYLKSRVLSSKTLVNIDSYSLVTVALSRIKVDGSELDKICSTYGVIRQDNDYKIISWQPSNSNAAGDCKSL